MVDSQHADALVFFGATGDLAYKKIFPSLQAMVQRGVLHVPVIGVAKNRFRSYVSGSADDPAFESIELLRGDSNRPLFVTAIGMAPRDAAALVRSMHGANRLPTLLKRVDRLCRQGLSPSKGVAVLERE